MGHVTRTWYDSANRLVSTTVNYSPTLSGHGPDNDWNLTTWYGYDPVGNPVAVTDTLGHVTRSWYDCANRLVSTTVNYSPTLSGHGPENDWNLTTEYLLDGVGDTLAMTVTQGYATHTGYDPWAAR